MRPIRRSMPQPALGLCKLNSWLLTVSQLKMSWERIAQGIISTMGEPNGGSMKERFVQTVKASIACVRIPVLYTGAHRACCATRC